jgi:hypothetical protein
VSVTCVQGALNIRSCKLCSGDKGIVVAGEYGIGLALLKAGLNMATLMSKYKQVQCGNARNLIQHLGWHRQQLCACTCSTACCWDSAVHFLDRTLPHTPRVLIGGSHNTGTATTTCTQAGMVTMFAAKQRPALLCYQ